MPFGDEPRSAERRVMVVSHDPAFPPASGVDLRNHRNAVSAAAFGPVCLVSLRPQAVEAVDPPTRIEALSIEGEARPGSIGWWPLRAEHRISRSSLMRLETLVRDFPRYNCGRGIGLSLLRPRDVDETAHPRHAQCRVRPAGHCIAPIGDLPRQVRHGPCHQAPRKKALALVEGLICSNEDRERLMTLFPLRHVDVVPNGIPTPAISPKHCLPRLRPTRTFRWSCCRPLDYPPNVDAVERLAGTILPRIRSLPAATLVIAGRRPKPARAGAGAIAWWLVEDPKRWRCSYPGRISPSSACGGGTRIKILEAMAWGVPVIATPLAAEGLGLVETEELLLSAKR